MNRLLFGLLVAIVAFGGSAFKNLEQHTTKFTGKSLPDSGYLVQTSPGNYEYVTSTTGDQGICARFAENPCKYIVTENSITDLPPYSASQAASFGFTPQVNNRLWRSPEE